MWTAAPAPQLAAPSRWQRSAAAAAPAPVPQPPLAPGARPVPRARRRALLPPQSAVPWPGQSLPSACLLAGLRAPGSRRQRGGPCGARNNGRGSSHAEQPPGTPPSHQQSVAYTLASSFASATYIGSSLDQAGGSRAGSPSPGAAGRSAKQLVGNSAKQLLQTAVHSLDMFEPRDSGAVASVEEGEGLDSLEEVGPSSPAAAATAHIVKANYEVLRLDEAGAVRRLRIKRRDLLREHGLQPRDLRRIDPTIDFTKTSPSITIKEDVLLLNLGGIRAIVTADKGLLFEPASNNTRKLLDTLVPRLQASAGQRLLARQQQAAAAAAGGDEGDPYRREGRPSDWARQAGSRAPPFELEVLEGVLMVATGRLDAEVLSVTRRVGELLQKLPRDINPVNLEELRRIKQALVELENKADTLRELLEQIMDDEDELRELNLSSRPRREERRKQRERERMERQLTRAREEMEEQARRNSGLGEGDERRSSSSSSSGSSSGGGGGAASSSSSSGAGAAGGSALAPSPPQTPSGDGSSSSSGLYVLPGSASPGALAAGSRGGGAGSGAAGAAGPGPSSEASAAARRDRIAELYAKHGLRRGPGGVIVPQASGGGGGSSSGARDKGTREEERWRGDGGREGSRDGGPRDRERDREREGDPEEEFQDAQDALEELAEQEEEEEELEEVEDLLEYYLQRASATQSEAERLLEGARDLEESIGVSLSARRYEVNRLELMLSMGSFAAALGAMIAGIFGMNMKSTLEMSVFGFWGVTGSIVVGCFYVFLAIMRYTQRKRIL